MTATPKHTGKIPPKPGKDVIYLDADDEITGIIDKVEAAKEKVVAVVLPKRSTSLQSIVNMRLLRRSADNADKNVVLITKEAALLPLAGAAGLHVADSLQGRPEVPPSPRPGAPAAGAVPETEDADLDEDNAKLDYHRSIGQLAAASAEDEEVSLDDEDEPDKAAAKADKPAKTPKTAKIKVPNFDRFRLMLGLGALGLILLIVFIILALTVLPKATITIQTSSTPLSANFNLTTSDTAKTLDEDKNVIPAVLKTSDFTSSQSVPATGQQNNGDKASGSVAMRTQDCSGVLPSAVSSGTGISANGLTFITQSKASFSPTVDGGGHCYFTSGNTAITAQQAGAKYNTSLSGASVQGYSGLSASGSASGGSDNIQTVVSQADIDNAKNKVSNTDTDNFSKNFQSDLGRQNLYLIPTTLKAADPVITSTPSVGQPGSTVSVSIKITYSVLTVQKSDLQKIITDNLKKEIKNNDQKISGDVVKDAAVSIQNQSSPTVATLQISENTTAVPILNVDNIKKQSAGKKSGAIADSINNLPGVKGVSVKLSPFWVSKAPKASKITIVQQQVKSGG